MTIRYPCLGQKNKNLALRSSQQEKIVAESIDESSSDSVAVTTMAQKFHKFLRFNKGCKTPFVDLSKDDSQRATHGKKVKPKKDKNTWGIHCFECSGYEDRVY
jgi:hypothetical protein